MRKSFSTIALSLTNFIIVFVVAGCGSTEDLEPVVPTSFILANPPSDSEIAPNAIITLIFDSDPGDVRVNAGVVEYSGHKVFVLGPFTPGPLTLTVEWVYGSKWLTYTVTTPD